jgi:hypothetical protein
LQVTRIPGYLAFGLTEPCGLDFGSTTSSIVEVGLIIATLVVRTAFASLRGTD